MSLQEAFQRAWGVLHRRLPAYEPEPPARGAGRAARASGRGLDNVDSEEDEGDGDGGPSGRAETEEMIRVLRGARVGEVLFARATAAVAWKHHALPEAVRALSGGAAASSPGGLVAALEAAAGGDAMPLQWAQLVHFQRAALAARPPTPWRAVELTRCNCTLMGLLAACLPDAARTRAGASRLLTLVVALNEEVLPPAKGLVYGLAVPPPPPPGVAPGDGAPLARGSARSLAKAFDADGAQPSSAYFVALHHINFRGAAESGRGGDEASTAAHHVASLRDPPCLDHYACVCRVGDTCVLLQSFYNNYTLAAWLDFGAPLRRPAGLPDAHPGTGLAGRPRFRGVLPRAEGRAALEVLDRLAGREQAWDDAARADYAALTGVVPPAGGAAPEFAATFVRAPLPVAELLLADADLLDAGR